MSQSRCLVEYIRSDWNVPSPRTDGRMDTFYKKMDDDLEVIDESAEESKVQQFYAGKTVFLTGSTGFMGKALVEKLLRGCPDLKRLYVMIRQKKGLSVEDRMKKFFSDVLFDHLRKINPDFESKVRAMEGDLVSEDLGLSEQDKKIVIEEANIIFHNASSVKFIERISSAARINVLGTAMTFDLAKQCKNIEGFMYVSTAYSHCYRLDISEELYPPPADLNMIKNLIAADETIPAGLSDKDLKSILGKYPNTYAYTKAVAEGVVAEAAKKASFPCIIYRPAVVLSSWKEPLRAWVDNLNGPAMLFIGYGLGILHAAYAGDLTIDFIPVDMSINALIVAMWDSVKNRPKSPEPFVYNYGSSTVKPISILGLRALSLKANGHKDIHYSVHTVWQHYVIFTKCVWYFAILHFFLHFIPAIFFDAYLLAKGKKPMALSAFKRATLSFSLLSYFSTREWKIDISETSKAVARMNSIDNELFFCDVAKLDWLDYAVHYWDGLRVYILKDPMTTVRAGMRKGRRLALLHNTIKYALIMLVAYFVATTIGLL